MERLRGIRSAVARRATATHLMAVVCFLLAVVPTGLYRPGSLHEVILACGVVTVLPVLFSARNLLIAWFLSVLLVLFLPRAYGARTGPELEWGWPWTIGLTVAVGFLLYRVALRLRTVVVVAVLAVTFVATWPRLDDWGDAALPGFLALGAVVLGNAVRQRREADGLRRAEQTRLVALEERTRIARELHDVVSHHMSALVLRTDAVSYRLPGLAPEVLDELDVIHRMARDGLTETRRMLVVLRADDGDGTTPQPGLSDVDAMVTRFRETGAEITLQADAGPVPAGVGLSAYRIIQEALSNSGRHAPGGAVSVGITASGDVLRVEVRNAAATRPALDDDPARPRHGLAGMAERVRVLGGELTSGPTPEGGFAVVADLPLHGGEDTA
ncbi:sensor histidine kinase [Lentzea sp.]|uniref:sensor histidine kinase n=1 Tax=Lentzea sp. TaxID=56099 RepID=UPI002C3F4ABA|nr:histidine kinase [Lentzea sp.]HUQ54105.1 histidine kinase [Lentzea sp.]